MRMTVRLARSALRCAARLITIAPDAGTHGQGCGVIALRQRAIDGCDSDEIALGFARYAPEQSPRGPKLLSTSVDRSRDHQEKRTHGVTRRLTDAFYSYNGA
jgi:hypothetical protein